MTQAADNCDSGRDDRWNSTSTAPPPDRASSRRSYASRRHTGPDTAALEPHTELHCGPAEEHVRSPVNVPGCQLRIVGAPDGIVEHRRKRHVTPERTEVPAPHEESQRVGAELHLGAYLELGYANGKRYGRFQRSFTVIYACTRILMIIILLLALLAASLWATAGSESGPSLLVVLGLLRI